MTGARERMRSECRPAPTPSGRVRDAILSLSLSNLLFIRGWENLFAAYGVSAYWIKAAPRVVDYVALILDVVVVGAALFTMLRHIRTAHRQEELGQKPRHGWLRPIYLSIYLVMIGVLLNSIAVLARGWFLRQSSQSFVLALIAVSGVAVLIAYLTSKKRAIRATSVILTVVFPLLLLSIMRAAYWSSTSYPRLFDDKPMARRLRPVNTGPHVVWMVFDEWDETLSFLDRPSHVQLPELDRIRTESVYSDNVTPAAAATDWAMTALTTGRSVLRFTGAGPDDIQLWFADAKDPVYWSKAPNVFAAARNLGFDTGIVGWALPYCRVLNNSLTGCWWQAGNGYDATVRPGMPELMAEQGQDLFERFYRSALGQSVNTRHHRWLYHAVLDQTIKTMVERPYNLTLIHFPIPHAPFFYNSKTGREDFNTTPILSLLRSPQEGYPDALVLLDTAIGRIRREMEAAGVWDNTTIIFTADHPYRHRMRLDRKPGSPYVPYIVKLANQHEALVSTDMYNALSTGKMLLAILAGEVKTPQDLQRWISAHHGSAADLKMLQLGHEPDI